MLRDGSVTARRRQRTFFLRPRWGTVLPDLAQLRENGASGTPSRAFWKCLRALRKKPKIWRILNIVKLYYRLILVPTLKFPKLQYFFDILGWRIFWRISTIFSRILTNFSRILTKILWQQWWGRRKVETRGGEMGVLHFLWWQGGEVFLLQILSFVAFCERQHAFLGSRWFLQPRFFVPLGGRELLWQITKSFRCFLPARGKIAGFRKASCCCGGGGGPNQVGHLGIFAGGNPSLQIQCGVGVEST